MNDSCFEEAQLNTHGAVIGRLLGKDIVEWFVDGVGRKYLFQRAAIVDKHGCADLAQLGEAEVLIAPGLIYRLEGSVAKALPVVCHSGYCECGCAVVKLENASGSGDVYRYPESIHETYDIFRCRTCRSVIQHTWKPDH